MLSEEKLIAECRLQKRAAQKELYERFVPIMRGLCLRYTKDEAESKDILQEGFIKVFNNIKQFSGKGSLEGWIKRIMINSAINYYKKSKRLNMEKLDDHVNYSETDNSLEAEIDRKDVSFDKIDFNLINSANFSQEELLSALQSIPEDFRIVFNMHFIENYKHEEIAELLNININTSRTRLLRARNLIQKKLYSLSIEKLAK